eukprot:scaffold236693_cov14-Tisochrysis_lutea.AAC.1
MFKNRISSQINLEIPSQETAKFAPQLKSTAAASFTAHYMLSHKVFMKSLCCAIHTSKPVLMCADVSSFGHLQRWNAVTRIKIT